MLYLLFMAIRRFVKDYPITLLLVLVYSVVGVLVVQHWRHRPTVAVQTVAPGVTSAVVNDTSLTPKEVTKVVSDPKDKALIAALMAQLAALKATPQSVVVTTARSESTGGGRVTTAPPEVATIIADAPPTITGMHYKDYRLQFDADLVNREVTYTLSQRFETVVATGRRADGTPLALAQLYELNETNERVPVPTVSTVGVFADETAPHWMRKLAVQGGLAVTRDAVGASANGAVVAAQWLKHGRTADASGVTYAILSPALVIAPGVTDIGILPVSVNLGRIPHQPFSNIWLSPFVAKSQRLGVTVTATF